MVAEQVHRIGIADNLRSELQSQVDVEWRIHRKETGARDGLVTAGDIKRAETAFKEARFNELAEARMVSNDVLNLPPSPAEQEAAFLAKIQAKNEREQSFADTVGGISERARQPRGDIGERISAQSAEFRESLAKAEAEAAFGDYAPIRSGYGDDRVTPEPPADDDAWPDPFGPILR